MQQLIQNLRNGKMELLEAAIPTADNGTIVVQNIFSAISTGTESNKVTMARANLITKAQQKPEQFKQVIDSFKTEGILSTYKKVRTKLDSPSPLGYSCVGKVIALGNEVRGFKIGDLVACGGDGANHAEYTKNKMNLCVKVPPNVRAEDASFTTIGAIALQGIRQAELKLGENCAVIGLGLIGQLTVQMLKASGIKVVGIDIAQHMVDVAHQSGADMSLLSSEEGLVSKVVSFSDGIGVDAVIITAGTSSNDPVELAGAISRQKGKVIIVGAVPTGFSRENYFKKELDLRMSCSYGPGRYDINYEEKGIDFPIGYVRWTENRNMQAFLSLVGDGKIDFSFLITHRFSFDNAEEAYRLILEKTSPFIGILFAYSTKNSEAQNRVFSQTYRKFGKSNVNVGFIGVGSFAQKYLLPNAFKKSNFIGVYDGLSYNATHISKKYYFKYATADFHEISEDKNINTVFIATRHNDHASQVIELMKQNKNIFVEKPLCLFLSELEEIASEYRKHEIRLMVGFNRRFSPFIKLIKNKLSVNKPIAINYRINAGFIPANSWFQDKDIGGGRIIGEVCHFIDLCCFLTGSMIMRIYSSAIPDPNNHMDTLIINLTFENGSIANIAYFANGSIKQKKEYLEIFSTGTSFVIDDFSNMIIHGNKSSKVKLSGQDKGHKNEITSFIGSINNGEPSPIPFNEIYHSTFATFKVIESLMSQKQVSI